MNAAVVHPPVDTKRFEAGSQEAKGDYHLVVSRLVPYKRVELAIEAFRELGSKLLIVGGGRDRERLESTAPENVKFLGHVPDEQLPALMGGAKALIFPAREDFGIVPVETMATGTPVVALGEGGALDTVTPGVSGVFFRDPTITSIQAAIKDCTETEWDRGAILASVKKFDQACFISKMKELATS